METAMRSSGMSGTVNCTISVKVNVSIRADVTDNTPSATMARLSREVKEHIESSFNGWADAHATAEVTNYGGFHEPS